MLLTHKQDARTLSTDLKDWRRISMQKNGQKNVQLYLKKAIETDTDIKDRDANSRKMRKWAVSSETAKKTRKQLVGIEKTSVW